MDVCQKDRDSRRQTQLNKKDQLNTSKRIDLDRIRGSTAIPASARSVLALDKPDKNDLGLHRLYQIKNNLGPVMEEDLFFRISDDGLHFIDPPSSCLSAILPPMNQKENAMNLISDLLSKGQVAAKEMEAKLREQGISEATMKRAKSHLDVNSAKIGNEWFWELR